MSINDKELIYSSCLETMQALSDKVDSLCSTGLDAHDDAIQYIMMQYHEVNRYAVATLGINVSSIILQKEGVRV